MKTISLSASRAETSTRHKWVSTNFFKVGCFWAYLWWNVVSTTQITPTHVASSKSEVKRPIWWQLLPAMFPEVFCSNELLPASHYWPTSFSHITATNLTIKEEKEKNILLLSATQSPWHFFMPPPNILKNLSHMATKCSLLKNFLLKVTDLKRSQQTYQFWRWHGILKKLFFS